MQNENNSYVPANMNNNNLEYSNKLLIKQIELTKQALRKDIFRYDASEVMERRIGADKLLASLKEYIDLGSEEAYKNLELIIEVRQKTTKLLLDQSQDQNNVIWLDLFLI